jgi:hypothetical protein
MALTTAKRIEILFDEVLEQYEKQQQMAALTETFTVDGPTLQNAQNQIWRQVEQQSSVFGGWDASGNFGDILELSYPARLDDPRNAAKELRADDFRDKQFMQRWARTSAARLTADQNSRIAAKVKDTGSLFYRATVDGTAGNTGYDAIKQATTILSERQAATDMGVTMFLNNRDSQLISSDVANRSDMNGMPEDIYRNGMIAYNTAGLNLYEGSYLPTITGGASPASTVAATVSQAPRATVTLAGEEFPADYRVSDDIALADASGYNVGDWVQFDGVNAVGLQDKTDTGVAMTFKIVEKTGNNIKVYPRPIALDDAALSDTQAAYANIATQIASGTQVTRLNTDASKRGNIFWCNDSVEILNGDAPLEYLSELDGMKVMSETLASGTKLYMAYQGEIDNFSLKCRLFTWYGITNKDPSRNGMAVFD